MTTREENLKKINDELEKLDDEQLEQVAGGTWVQTADDSRFLNVLNGSTDRYGATRISLTSGTKIEEEVQRAWAALGIEFTWHGGAYKLNEYRLNGNKINQNEAYEHAMKVVGKHLELKDWYW